MFDLRNWIIIQFYYLQVEQTMPPKQKSTPQTPATSFKRYCEYEAIQSLTNSQQSPAHRYPASQQHSLNDQYENHNGEVETQVIMFPLPRETRSKTAFAARGLAFKNIGQNIQVKPRLGQRNVYSRENIQSMNKKIRMLKESMFASANLDKEKSPEKSPSEIRLSGFSSLMTSFTLAGKNKRNIHSCAQLRSHKPQQIPSTAPATESMIQKAKPRIRPHHKSSKQIGKTSQNGTLIKPNNFKATLKQKHIDDNPKVLANIIRKKVECMRSEQVHQYIHSLMRRSKQ